MESSLKKVTKTIGKRKTSCETPADVDLRTLGKTFPSIDV